MRNDYGFTAKIYDQLLYPFLHSIRKTVMNELAGHEDSRILDLCCGTGDQLKTLSRNGFIDLHCLYLSEPMLHVAKRGGHDIGIHKQDASRTGFRDKEFDIVMLSFALHEKDSQTQINILRETDRILKDDGLLLVVDFVFDGRSKMLGRMGATLIEWMAGGEHYSNFRRYKNSGSLSTMIDGKMFRNVKNIYKQFNVVTISTYTKSCNS